MQNPHLSSRRSFLGSLLAGAAGAVALIGGRARVASSAPLVLPQAEASQAPDPTPTVDPVTAPRSQRQAYAERRMLPMSSVSPILPGQARQVTGHPSRALDIERIFIGTALCDWIVNDIKLDGESVLLQAGDLPGELFSNDPRVDSSWLFDDLRIRVLPSTEFSMTVTYIGPLRDGAVFTCCAIGRIAG